MNGDFPKHVYDLLMQQMASMGRVGATRFFLSPDVASPAAAGGISAPSSIRFNVNGIALCIQGQEGQTASSASFAQCAFRCQIGGTEDLFVDGQGGPASMPMLLAFGGVNNWMSVMRRIREADLWTFTFTNNTAAGVITPKIAVAVISDQDIAAMTARR